MSALIGEERESKTWHWDILTASTVAYYVVARGLDSLRSKKSFMAQGGQCLKAQTKRLGQKIEGVK